MLLLGETSITPKLQDNNEDDVFWRLAKDIGKAKAKFQTLGYTLIVEPLYFNCTRGKKKNLTVVLCLEESGNLSGTIISS